MSIGSNGAGANPNWSPYTVTTTGTNTTWAVSPTNNTNFANSVLDLQGEKADIRINGESLCDTLRSIQDRLNILRPNAELESKWDQLRELGEAYRKLEAELEEKQRMWDTIKKMPAPEIK